MSVYVLGVATHPASLNESSLRLEEMAYHTAHAALDAAGVTRRQLDSLTLGACDELDGRPISSMLMSAPAGGYGTDEIKVTDSGASALCLAYARFLAGESQLGLVANSRAVACKSAGNSSVSINTASSAPNASARRNNSTAYRGATAIAVTRLARTSGSTSSSKHVSSNSPFTTRGCGDSTGMTLSTRTAWDAASSVTGSRPGFLCSIS